MTDDSFGTAYISPLEVAQLTSDFTGLRISNKAATTGQNYSKLVPITVNQINIDHYSEVGLSSDFLNAFCEQNSSNNI